MVREKNLTMNERERLLGFLLGGVCNGRLKHGVQKEAARIFLLSPAQVCRLWNKWVRQAEESEDGFISVFPPKSLNGARNTYNREELKLEVQKIPYHRRRTQRALAGYLGVSRSTVHRFKCKKVFRRTLRRVHPILNDNNRLSRVLYCLSHVNLHSVPQTFNAMWDYVHLDEKWFYICEIKGHFYAIEEENINPIYIKNKNYLQKVMFLAAVARPRYLSTGEFFDGKIGIWPFAEMAPAKRNSINCPRGTLVLKNIKVTKAVFRKFLIEKLVPGIVEKWPRSSSETGKLLPETVRLQFDNCPVHLKDYQFNAAMENVATDGLTIIPVPQPSNSPDLNCLDLGVFPALQADYYANPPTKFNELIAQVTSAYNNLSPEKIDSVFMTLQACLNEVIECDGTSNYCMPRKEKDLQGLPIRMGEKVLAVTETASDWFTTSS